MIELVPARPEDEAFLYKLYVSTREHEAAAWGFGEREAAAFFTMQYDLQRRSYRMQFPDAEHSIVHYGKQPAGRILVSRGQSDTLLVDISLMKEFRGQGIGGSLIRNLQEEVRATGSLLRLHVLKHSPAVRLYERFGFKLAEPGDVYDAMEWDPSGMDNGRKE